MKAAVALIAVLLGAPFASLPAADLSLKSPLEYEIIQRSSAEKGAIRITGSITDAPLEKTRMEVRLIIAGKKEEAPWREIQPTIQADSFQASIDAPAGGWHRLEVRTCIEDRVIAQCTVARVGIGEVFVVAGQSNSANHGEVRQTTLTGRVANFDGQKWQLANDPQPGASGNGGSFLPVFGDAIVEAFNVPVGFIACGIGATSVREWLPKGATFPNPPTIESRVEKLPSGEWMSNGAAYTHFVGRMSQVGPRGFRAVLWHQGESDANQKDTTRTLSGGLYRQSLERIIRESRHAIGWEAPWFVAQVSYHVPGDEASPEIRDAQAALWTDGVALAGPDSDALKGDFRESNGQGVHFSGKGLREHGAKWAEKVTPWLSQLLKGSP